MPAICWKRGGLFAEDESKRFHDFGFQTQFDSSLGYGKMHTDQFDNAFTSESATTSLVSFLPASPLHPVLYPSCHFSGMRSCSFVFAIFSVCSILRVTLTRTPQWSALSCHFMEVAFLSRVLGGSTSSPAVLHQFTGSRGVPTSRNYAFSIHFVYIPFVACPLCCRLSILVLFLSYPRP